MIQKVMSAFVILLVLYLISRNLSALGFNAGKHVLDQYIVATVEDEEQVLEIDLTYSSYADIAVKNGYL